MNFDWTEKWTAYISGTDYEGFIFGGREVVPDGIIYHHAFDFRYSNFFNRSRNILIRKRRKFDFSTIDYSVRLFSRCHWWNYIIVSALKVISWWSEKIYPKYFSKFYCVNSTFIESKIEAKYQRKYKKEVLYHVIITNTPTHQHWQLMFRNTIRNFCQIS